MRGLLSMAWLLSLSACALAFSPGVRPAPPPAKFQDIEGPTPREEERKEIAASSASPTFGMSLVVGGNPLDSGALPKPPVPVVMPP
jgi:hypothetical protein